MDISEDPENAYIIEPLINLAKTKIPLELYAEKIDIFGRDNVFQRELLRKAPIIRAYDKFPAESLALFDSIYGLKDLPQPPSCRTNQSGTVDQEHTAKEPAPAESAPTRPVSSASTVLTSAVNASERRLRILDSLRYATTRAQDYNSS